MIGVEILTTSGAAELLHVSIPYVRELANRGEIPGIQFGDDWRFVRSDLLSCISDRGKKEQAARKFDAPMRAKIKTEPGRRGRKRTTETKED